MTTATVFPCATPDASAGVTLHAMQLGPSGTGLFVAVRDKFSSCFWSVQRDSWRERFFAVSCRWHAMPRTWISLRGRTFVIRASGLKVDSLNAMDINLWELPLWQRFAPQKWKRLIMKHHSLIYVGILEHWMNSLVLLKNSSCVRIILKAHNVLLSFIRSKSTLKTFNF